MTERRQKTREYLLKDEIFLSECIPRIDGIPVALLYPNTYSVGMSSLGYLTVYRMLSDTGFKPERFFCDINKPDGMLVSVDTGTPLASFDKIAIHFSFELDYIRAIKALIDSGIKPNRVSRADMSGPIIIAGGIAPTANPLPLVNFIDAVFLGELDQDHLSGPVTSDLFTELVHNERKGWFNSNHYLYSPGTYKVQQQRSSNWVRTENFSPVITKNTHFRNMNLIEISRGCQIGCKFCLNAAMNKGVRELDEEKILQAANRHRENSDRVGLIGGIPSLHSSILSVLRKLLKYGFRPSLSSLSVLSLNPELLELLVKGGMKTLSIGVESFDEILQRKFGKPVPFGKLVDGVTSALKAGVREIKIYLMLGLPGASDDEVEAIIESTIKLRDIAQTVKPGSRITLSLNPFIPKVAVEYEMESFAGEKDFRLKIGIIRKALAKRGINIKSESYKGSFFQYLLSCGDEKMGTVISGAAAGANMKQTTKRIIRDNEYFPDVIEKIGRIILR